MSMIIIFLISRLLYANMPVNNYIDTVTIVRPALTNRTGPVYKAIANALADAILQGHIEQGMKLPPLRIFADELSVTVGTINRAYSEVERLGLVSSRVGDGTYVSQSMGNGEGIQFENTAPDKPGVIDLTRNTHIPGEDLEMLSRTLAVLSRDRRKLVSINEYLPDTGRPHHRLAGAKWLRYSGLEIDPEQVVVTNGAQHALLCTMIAALQVDDLVVAEQLSYPGLVAATRALGLRLKGLPMDEQGLVPSAVEETCRQQKVSALYCTPTLQNPTTAVMSAERKQQIAEICRKHNVLIIEDDAHGVLTDNHPPAFAEYVPERAVLISSLSKAVSAGLRVGFIATPKYLLPRIAGAIRTSSWMATPLTTEIGTGWILDDTAIHLREQQRKEVQRRKALVAPLLSSLDVRTHDDCCHYWISLPEMWRASVLVMLLEEQDVLVKSAEAFAVGKAPAPQCIRVSVSGVATDEELYSGFRKLVDNLLTGPHRSLGSMAG